LWPEVAVAEHGGRNQASGPTALADLLSALQGKLSTDLDLQVLVPRPAGNAQMGTL
jgi:hypothetical protein